MMKKTLTFALVSMSCVTPVFAATLNATFQNQTTKSQTLQSPSGWSTTPTPLNMSIPAGSNGPGSANSTGNIVVSARYVDSTSVGCTFQATASKGIDGRYSFSRAANRFGSSGGRQATCVATITSSSTATGIFSATFTTSGF
jgi:pectate lyase